MIKIYSKTQEELKEEQATNDWAVREVKGSITKKACPTYLVQNDGTKVDSYNLTEKDVLTLINYDLKDFCNENGSYKKNNRTGLDTFKLLDTLSEDFKFSHQGIITLMQMETAYGSIAKDVVPVADKDNLRGSAKEIATYIKQSNGDFSETTNEETIEVLQQMQINEMNKKKTHSTKR